MIDNITKQEIGYWFMAIIAAFGLALGDWVVAIGWTPLWVVFILAVWYSTDILLLGLIRHYLKVEKKVQT